jgi:hypothetical protein
MQANNQSVIGVSEFVPRLSHLQSLVIISTFQLQELVVTIGTGSESVAPNSKAAVLASQFG